ncbi:MAG: hypothetical protein LBF04_02635 [Prevotellaceae bacterium]|jgi:hypothetical protein|nr:hypothetical protein [Prevotellaceae bacterium]
MKNASKVKVNKKIYKHIIGKHEWYCFGISITGNIVNALINNEYNNIICGIILGSAICAFGVWMERHCRKKQELERDKKTEEKIDEKLSWQ